MVLAAAEVVKSKAALKRAVQLQGLHTTPQQNTTRGQPEAAEASYCDDTFAATGASIVREIVDAARAAEKAIRARAVSTGEFSAVFRI